MSTHTDADRKLLETLIDLIAQVYVLEGNLSRHVTSRDEYAVFFSLLEQTYNAGCRLEDVLRAESERETPRALQRTQTRKSCAKSSNTSLWLT